MNHLERALSEAEAAGIRQTKIRVGDLDVNFARCGRGPPLLLLHGWPEFWLVWRPVIERLRNSFELIAPDLRGFGATGKTSLGPDATATADRHAEDMLGLMTALGIEKFGIVSGDVGAYVAQAMSLTAPQRLTGTLYFSTPYPGIGKRFGEAGHLIEVWYQYFQQQPWAAELVGSSREACRIYLRHFLTHWAGGDPKVFEPQLEVYVDNFLKPGNLQGGFDWYLSVGAARRLIIEGKAPPRPKIDVPTRCLPGSRDPILKAEWADRLGEYWTNFSLEVVDAGHFVHAEIPDRAAREVRIFFEGLAAASK